MPEQLLWLWVCRLVLARGMCGPHLSPVVWAFLNEPRQEGDSLRARLIAKWGGKEPVEKRDQYDMPLLLSAGGRIPFGVCGGVPHSLKSLPPALT